MTKKPSEPILARVADIPSLDQLLRADVMAPLLLDYGHSQLATQLREHLNHLRQKALNNTLPLESISFERLAHCVGQQLAERDAPVLSTVFNLTGTVLHTNLGRALLAPSALEAMCQVALQPSNLEYNLDTGRRGDRDAAIEALVCELTGAEAATVVNNNAAAVLLLLNTLALNREVIVSRGELVEIGGSFRIPEIMERAGAHLCEVGTTNRTHLADYQQAIKPQSAMLLKVHCSNYEVVGFVKSVALKSLAELGRQHHLPSCVDLGSGTLIDLTQWGLPREITVQETLAAGADVVTFSGDKLLGGPQAGFLVGRRAFIDQIKRNPLKRALRVDKLTLAALEATLRLYRHPEQLANRLPTLRFLSRSVTELQEQARRLYPKLAQALGGLYVVTAAPMESQIGSGSLPSSLLPSFGFKITSANEAVAGKGLQDLHAWLRQRSRPIIGRLADKSLWLDLRTLERADEAEFLAQFKDAP